MSENELKIGRLIPVKICDSIEGTCYLITIKEGWKRDREFHESYRDVVNDEGYGKYHIINDKIYLVEYEVNDPYRDIMEANKNPDGTIDFTLKYYNGGCSFGEALDVAISKMEE